jgi:alpha-glucosidase
VTARKEKQHRHYSGKDWYLGGVTDENARSVTVPLDFLDDGQRYEAHIYRDSKDTDWRENPYALTVEKKTVSAKDTLIIRMAESGGFAVRFKAL